MSGNTGHGPVTVNVQSGAGEILRIVATILLFGGAGAIAWSVAQGQHRELAATGMSMMIVMMIRLMYARGMVTLPGGTGGDDFTATKTLLSQVSGEYKRWLAGTSMPALALISMAYAVGFLILRAAVGAAFGVFGNVFVAGGAAAMIGAIVVFPTLVPSIVASLRKRGVVETQPQAPAPQAPVQPAPQQPFQPQAQAPQQPAPTPPAEPAPQAVRVVRRVKKGGTENV